MLVFVIPSWYPSETNPNNGSFFREQSHATASPDTTLVLLNGTFRSREAYFAHDNCQLLRLNDDGMPIYQYVTPNFMLSRNTWLGVRLAQRNIGRVFRAAVMDHGYPDIIHAHSFYPAGYVACLFGSTYDIPVVVTEHSSRVLTKALSGRRKAILRTVVQNADAFLCVSKSLAKAVDDITNVRGKTEVFPNLVSSQFRCSQTRNDGPKRVFTLLFVGNLIASKNPDILVEAFAEAFSVNDSVQLRIVGSGPLEHRLSQRVRKLGREAQITLTGQLTRENVVREMQVSDAFVSASRVETFGVAYIEAMACGNPVVTYRNGGSDDLITPQNGILLDTLSVEAMSRAMRYIVDNAARYDRAGIARDCISTYGEPAYRNRVVKLYRHLLRKRRSDIGPSA